MESKAATGHAYAQIKLNNLVRVYNLIREKKAISRSSLARETGMSAMSMTRICAQLIEAGLVSETADPAKGIGRKTLILRPIVEAMYCACLAIDVEFTQFAIFDAMGQCVAYADLLATIDMTFFDIIDAAVRRLPELLREAGIDGNALASVGISCVGSVEKDVLTFVPQFNWSEVPARAYAEEAFGLPVLIENDCKTGLVGATANRDGLQTTSNVVYIKIGKRGVGSAAIVNGQLLRGANNVAGEIGHITVDKSGMRCDCGRRGCLQTFLAEQFLLLRAQELDSSFVSLGRIFDAASKGSVPAIAFLHQINEYINIALNIVACVYNPELILLDNRYLSEYGDWYARATEKMPDLLFRPILDHVEVESVERGKMASLYGMYCLMQNDLLRIRLSPPPNEGQ